MKNIFKILSTIFAALLAGPVLAQQVEMADTMRSEGKIYVVVGIVLIVLVGLIAYLFMLDRRVKKLENRQK
ncbi:MAG: CcmD family protein [Cyclobacteriaceae bacterium]|nr:CcmD family protein [Cyclobacteriaceae bacterium]